ncbi:MAG: N-6 DNA methylase [Nitrospirae bacterium]|nr:N-6 DNA methylase [Nitrospirota bacterium]
MLAKLGREGGFGGEFYTPRPIIEFVVNMVDPKLGETVYDPAMGSASPPRIPCRSLQTYAHGLGHMHPTRR